MPHCGGHTQRQAVQTLVSIFISTENDYIFNRLLMRFWTVQYGFSKTVLATTNQEFRCFQT